MQIDTSPIVLPNDCLGIIINPWTMFTLSKYMVTRANNYLAQLGVTDTAAVRLLRMAVKTGLIGDRADRSLDNDIIKFKNKHTTDIVNSMIMSPKLLIMQLAYDETLRINRRRGIDCIIHDRNCVMFNVHDLLKRKYVESSFYLLSSKEDPELVRQTYLWRGNFIICVYNMFNAMCGSSTRLKIEWTSDYLKKCHRVNKYECLNDQGWWREQSVSQYVFQFRVQLHENNKYRTNWFYKK